MQQTNALSCGNRSVSSTAPSDLDDEMEVIEAVGVLRFPLVTY
jgi:hypothetical protein